MEEWSSSQGQSTDYGKLWIRGSETWNSHCYSQLTPVVPRLQLSLIQQWELEHSKFHWRKERLVLEAIQGGESAKDIYSWINPWIARLSFTPCKLPPQNAACHQRVPHRIQFGFSCYFKHRICPHRSHTPSSDSGSLQPEQGHVILTFGRENFQDFAHSGEFAKIFTKRTSARFSHFYVTM